MEVSLIFSVISAVAMFKKEQNIVDLVIDVVQSLIITANGLIIASDLKTIKTFECSSTGSADFASLTSSSS